LNRLSAASSLIMLFVPDAQGALDQAWIPVRAGARATRCSSSRNSRPVRVFQISL